MASSLYSIHSGISTAAVLISIREVPSEPSSTLTTPIHAIARVQEQAANVRKLFQPPAAVSRGPSGLRPRRALNVLTKAAKRGPPVLRRTHEESRRRP